MHDFYFSFIVPVTLMAIGPLSNRKRGTFCHPIKSPSLGKVGLIHVSCISLRDLTHYISWHLHNFNCLPLCKLYLTCLLRVVKC